MSDLQNTKLRKLLRNARMVKDDNASIVQTLLAQVDRLTAERDDWHFKYDDAIKEWANDFRDHSDEIVERYTNEIKRLRKLLEDANRGAERNAHVNRLLAADLLKVSRERDACRKLVMEHNAQLQDDCESRACDSDMRQCGDCPVRVFGIDVPPELEQSP